MMPRLIDRIMLLLYKSEQHLVHNKRDITGLTMGIQSPKENETGAILFFADGIVIISPNPEHSSGSR